MKLEIEMDSELLRRLQFCAEHHKVSAEFLAHAYIEDWLSIEYAELKGRLSRRGIYRDGPIAFDPIAAESAARVEEDLRRRGAG